jgi:hypothetical protein
LKKVLFFIFLFGLAGCSAKPDFSKIKPGMRSADVIRLAGVPYRKQRMSGVDWWLYNDSAQHIVVVDHDTVANCSTQKEAIEIMTHALRAIDSLRAK